MSTSWDHELGLGLRPGARRVHRRFCDRNGIYSHAARLGTWDLGKVVIKKNAACGRRYNTIEESTTSEYCIFYISGDLRVGATKLGFKLGLESGLGTSNWCSSWDLAQRVGTTSWDSESLPLSCGGIYSWSLPVAQAGPRPRPES